MTIASDAHVLGNANDYEYETYLRDIKQRFLLNTPIGSNLFTTQTDNLYDTFLAMLPEDQRQYHNCNACRKFVNTYGGLVTIDENGVLTPVMWDESDTPEPYLESVRAMRKRICTSPVTGVFYSSEKVWGTPVTGVWKHFGIRPHERHIFRDSVLTASQLRAEKYQDFMTLARALADFDQDVLTTAVQLLQSDALYRSAKVLGVAKWLLDIHTRRSTIKHHLLRDNILWGVVASAPAGFCHPRSTTIGTLLEDIASGLTFDAISRRFAEKMNPTQHQRPKAEPSVGNINQAEKLVEKLGIASSLKRRFAQLDDIVALWTPKAPVREENGVFGHLKSTKRSSPILSVPTQTMTWQKFRRQVLPDVTEMFFHIPTGAASFTALVTAEDPNAPPILQWDTEAQRNPVSWYVYSSGSNASQWNLRSGDWKRITAVTLKPSMWHIDEDSPKMSHQGKGVIFILEGVKDTRSKGSGLGLFPEILKSELHGIRSTIEAYSRRGEISGSDQATACGIILADAAQWNARVRVMSNGLVSEYVLDRWD